ncbi:MAG: two pore domain potassium channel family protein [Chromatiales bacterium]|nr:MAG: two pore domain potassium channel family protein [Chromatiales bacterium]
MDLPLLVTLLTTCVIVFVCVLLHYEGLRALSRWITSDLLPPRGRIVTMIFGLILLHAAEIWVFAGGYFYLEGVTGYADFLHFGSGEGLVERPMTLFDHAYYSVVTYTTLGFGDIVPVGAVRFMTGTEAVTGLALITWSASFIFLEMQRYWGRD